MNIVVRKFNNILEYNDQSVPKPISDLKIFYQNVRSLRNKFEEIELLIEQYTSDIVVLTETWISKAQKKFYNFKSYNSIFSCRERQGGGLGMFIKKEIKYNLLENFESDDISYIIIELPKLHMFILSIYRPPSYNINDFLNSFDQKVSTLNDRKCLIIGDINIDLLISNKASETLNNIFITNNFYLCNEAHPTRYSAQRESLLDHIALNFEYNEINLNIIENCLSDHAIQILNLGNNNNRDTKTSVYRNLNKIDYKL